MLSKHRRERWGGELEPGIHCSPMRESVQNMIEIVESVHQFFLLLTPNDKDPWKSNFWMPVIFE